MHMGFKIRESGKASGPFSQINIFSSFDQNRQKNVLFTDFAKKNTHSLPFKITSIVCLPLTLINFAIFYKDVALVYVRSNTAEAEHDFQKAGV